MLNKLQNENFIDSSRPDMIGDGIHYRETNLITHTSLHHKNSAIETFHTHQKILLFIFLILMGAGIALDPLRSLIIFISGMSLLYFADLLFNLFLIVKSFQHSSEIQILNTEIKKLKDRNLPIYTIFCPLYKEWQVIPQFTLAIASIDWPKDKLDIQLLLEEDDKETIVEIKKQNLPKYFRMIIVPHGQPKTKPKACNYGLGHAKGKYAVIFDAEDIPDPDQLKKAYITFKKLKNDKIICAQAKLNFYNARQNILTRLFSAEYALWFDLVLIGLQSIKSPIPLGGTSNHFRTKDLNMLKGWDPFNVTEDCDLGMRIAKAGFHTAIFNSSTMGEANSKLGNWMRQRSRWIKGYMQTYLVHMRRPREFTSEIKKPDILTFQLVVGGKVLSAFINPAMWIMTIAYFSFRSTIGPTIALLYPAPVLYIAIFSLVFGNFLYVYYYMIGCVKRGQWDLVKYVFFVPFYWLLISIAGWKALYQLFFRPHFWEKTVHGFHLNPNKNENE